MAFTSTDLDNIKAAISTGELEVQIGDKRVRYRSMAELLQAKRVIEDELAGLSGRRRPRAALVSFSRG